MNATGFATTKIQPPRARSARIERPALDAALGQALRSRRLVLLMAPAGFGKTSALAAQIESLGPGTALAWFSFDEDDDAAHLFAGLAGALEPLDLPWRSAPAALAAQLGEQGENGGSLRGPVAELVNALAAAGVPHGVIVLDDLHRVQSPAVNAFLDELIERLPAQWTVVISTRVAPRLALARWRAAGELAEFTQEQLRFSADEARALVQADQEVQPVHRIEIDLAAQRTRRDDLLRIDFGRDRTQLGQCGGLQTCSIEAHEGLSARVCGSCSRSRSSARNSAPR